MALKKKAHGELIVLSGPSGVGKSTVIAELLGQRQDIYFSVSFTTRKIIQDKLASGIDVLLDIEVQGAAKVRAKCPEAVLIFIIPPSFEELSRRLRGRNTDSEEVIAGRLTKAREEYAQISNYDYLVVNDKVSEAAAEIIAILTAEDCRARNRMHLVEGI